MSIYSNNTPYAYLIGWSELGIYYYGRRTAIDCHPDEFWVTYFTSSDYVAEFRKEHGEPDIREIRKKFTDENYQTRVDRCIKWETTVIERANMVKSVKWLNKSNGGIKFSYLGIGEDAPRYIDTIFKWENIETGDVVEMTRYYFVKTYGLRESAASMLINGDLYKSCGWKIHGTIKPPDKRPNKAKSMSGTSNVTYDDRIYLWQNTKSGAVENMTGLAFREKYLSVLPSDVSDLKKAFKNNKKLSRKSWCIVGIK